MGWDGKFGFRKLVVDEWVVDTRDQSPLMEKREKREGKGKEGIIQCRMRLGKHKSTLVYAIESQPNMKLTSI